MESVKEKIVIGICDDQPQIIKELEKIVMECIDNKENVEMVTFESGRAVTEYNGKMNILFLDIEMPEMDGIEVGRYMLNNQADCKIIMATSKIERIKETFGIRAFRFAEKPFDKEEIKKYLDEAFDSLIGFSEIEFYYNRMSYMVRQRDIKYIRAFDSCVEALVGDKIMRKEISVAQLEQELDARLFYRVHKSYIVNMLHIDNLKKDIIHINGEQIKVPRIRLKAFEKAFVEFDLKYRG